MKRRTTAGAALCVSALALTAIASGAAPAGAATSSPTPSARPTVTVTADDPDGSARSLRTSPGHPLARPSGLSASASSTTIATTVVGSLSGQLGTTGDTFTPKAVRRSSAGGDVVRLQQTVAGVPVLGGEVVVDLDPTGATRSVHSETLPSAAPSTTARVPSALAVTRAVAAVVLSTKARASDLRTTTPTLAIYDPRIFGAPGAQRATLVWQTTVRSSTDRSIDHLVLVDATRGFVTLDLDQLGRGKVIQVCDADSTATEVPCQNLKDPLLLGTGDDLFKAFQGANATYDFYANYLGRDSVDNHGLTLNSTVRYCPAPTQCPYQNAFWDGTQMVYGAGYPQADDVVAHELTHGVTQYNSGLFYYFQSGAINESLSDIFGEYVDQTDGIGTDTPQTAWQLGEDLAGGRIRDMADPTIQIGGFSQPDRTGSPFYESHTNAGSDVQFDSGGVHGNSGVGNKLGYLLGNPVGFTVAAGLGQRGSGHGSRHPEGRADHLRRQPAPHQRCGLPRVRERAAQFMRSTAVRWRRPVRRAGSEHRRHLGRLRPGRQRDPGHPDGHRAAQRAPRRRSRLPDGNGAHDDVQRRHGERPATGCPRGAPASPGPDRPPAAAPCGSTAARP